MLPEHYEPRHHAQQLGFKGPDLAKKHHHAVLTSARVIPLELIRSVNDTQFCINSQSDLGRCYLVDIQRLICNCLDFPRVQICKHLCAVKIWYPFIPPADDLTQDLQRSSSISYQLAATSSSLSGTGCHLLHQSQYQLSHWVPCQIRIPSAQIKISGRQQ